MNGDSETFDVKMVILKYVQHQSVARFEFIPDDHEQVLTDLVVPSLRSDFKLDHDKHFVLDSHDGQMHLFKILKSLKLYEWKMLTSNAFAVPGSTNSVETIFYYEKSKSIGNAPVSAPVVSKYSFKRTVPTAAPHPETNSHTSYTNHTVHEHSSGKSGIEEEKSANVYSHKPPPSVPLRHFVPTSSASSEEHGSNGHHTTSASTSETDFATRRVSTNREKLLQKYNQHRRLSTGKSAAEPEAPVSPGRASAIASAGSTSNASSSSATAASKPPMPSTVSAATHTSSSASTFASTPPPTPLTAVPTSSVVHASPATATVTANANTHVHTSTPAADSTPTVSTADAPRVNPASAYPSLVRRISSKGFSQVSNAVAHATNHSNNSSSNGGGFATPKVLSRPASSDRLADISSSTSDAGHGSSSYASKHNAPAPPTAPVSSSSIAYPAGAETAIESTPTSTTIAAAPLASVPTAGSAATAHADVSSSSHIQSQSQSRENQSQAEESDEPVFRISSHNPLTAPSRAPQSSLSQPTPESDQHEASRTNHYSKLGSAFFSGNALGPGARRSGGRGSSGYASMSAQK